MNFLKHLWLYATSPLCRFYSHLYDVQAVLDRIENERRAMLDHQSRTALIAEFGEEQGRGIWEQSREMAAHAKRHGLSHSINADGSCNVGCC